MIKKLAFIFLALGFASAVWAGPSDNRTFEADGEVVTVSPVYSRITIRHEAIPGFSGGGDTEFSAASKELLDKISTRDLIHFTIVDMKGDVQITAIERTGRADKAEEPRLGQAIQQTLEGAGEAVTGVASIVPPAGEAVGAVTGATTGATGSVLSNVDPQSKQDF